MANYFIWSRDMADDTDDWGRADCWQRQPSENLADAQAWLSRALADPGHPDFNNGKRDDTPMPWESPAVVRHVAAVRALTLTPGEVMTVNSMKIMIIKD